MGDKTYVTPTDYSNVNNIYPRTQCAKQNYDPNQQFYTYNIPPINNSYNTGNNVLDGFNIISQQPCPKNQNVCMYSNQLDLTNWDQRLVEEPLKVSDKIDVIEITSKDLSPASYCSNLDIYMPEFYKTLGKDFNYYNNGQWYTNTNNTTKINEYPSCAQINQNVNLQEKTVKYCSIQKSQDFDYNLKNYGYNMNDVFVDQTYCKTDSSKIVDVLTNQDYTYYYNNNKIPDGQFFQQVGTVPEPFQTLNIDQQTESNDESDIIVEESDEEATDCNEYDDKKFPTELDKCVVCNISYVPLSTQFYFVTSKNPLSMSTQKPIYSMLGNMVGHIHSKINYLCSECLGLINTIDHLQLKLENFKMELLLKFQRTCLSNNLEYIKPTSHKQKRIIARNTRYKCKLCRKILDIKLVCRRHIKRHKFKGFLCELCGTICKTRQRFKLHRIQHKSSESPKINSFKCQNCPKIFRTKSNLIEHENYCLGILPFSCKFCEKKFPSNTKLKNHVKLKHDKKFIAICSICNIGFVKLSDYKSHKITHSTDKKYTCTKCDKSYKTLSNLNFHMKIHNNQLPFICEICDKGFMRKEYLEAHVNNHKGIKNFSCSICEKKFVSQKNLDSHLKYHDGSAKTKTCNICGKVMTTGFEEHLRIHNNLREFECDQCDNRFNTKGTLAKHKKRKHPSS